MRSWSVKFAATGLLCFANFANAADNPYGAPAALPKPSASTRVSPYWTQYASHADGSPESIPAVEETVVQGYNGNNHRLAPAASYGQPTYSTGGNSASGNCGGGYDAGGYDAGGYEGGSQYADAVGGCGDYDTGGPVCLHFYASVAGLAMSRGPGNRVFTTYQDSNPNNQLMHTQDASLSGVRSSICKAV